MATVIKAGEAGKVVRRLATVDLADHLREAHSVIDAARARAAAMVRDAQRESDRIREAARSEGFTAGHAQGSAEGRAEGLAAAHDEALAAFALKQESLIAALSTAVGSLGAMKTDLEIAAQRDVLEFAVKLACKLTFEVGNLHHESAQENLRRALGLIGKRSDVIIRVNSADLDSMTLFAPQLMEQLGETGRVTVEVDESLKPGGCRVHTPTSDVDATLETQTAELVRLLLGNEPPATQAVTGTTHV